MSHATNPSAVPEEDSRGRGLGRIAVLLLLTGILLLLSWLGWKAWRLYQSTSSLLARQTEIEQLLEGGWSQADPRALEALVMGTRGDFVALQQDISFLIPILPYLSALPEIGPLAAAAPHLLEMADGGTEASAYGIRGLTPALVELQSEERDVSPLSTLADTITETRPDLAQASIALDRVAGARAQITEVESLPWRVRTLLELSDRWLPIGQDFLRMALVLPELMGYNGQRRYLIIAQNEDELRPTGGFISGAGYLEVEDGQITSLDFLDANTIDAWAAEGWFGGQLLKPYSEPPMPLKEFMLLDLFLFRDANFWPDFAVSAQKAMDLYAYGRSVPALDGAIGIDQQFLQLLLDGMGPVTLSDGEIIRGSNVIKSLQEAWTLQDGVGERKAFLGPFAAAILGQIDGGVSDIDPLHLLQNLNQALQQKDLQLYMRDPRIAVILAANDWDGRLPPPVNHDTLMLVDSNLGYNKANYFIEQTAMYDVQLTEGDKNTAQLTVTHKHDGIAVDEDCGQGAVEEYQEGAPYLALTEKCYYNYFRVYVPEGSELIDGPQNVIPGQTWFGGFDWQPPTEVTAELPGYTTFSSWMMLPQGSEQTNEFTYSLPESIVQTMEGTSVYSLQLRKQAGVDPYPIHISVAPPPGKNIISVFPEPIAVEGSTQFFVIEMDRDQGITVAYR